MRLLAFMAITVLAAASCTSSSGSETEDSRSNLSRASNAYAANDTATFAGGCFWCMEAVFERVKGVADVVSGYSGGGEESPTYYEVGSGKTGHAEAVQVFFDSAVVNYAKLLDIFFHLHDPTQADGQHPDYGPQYRSAVFYHNAKQAQQINSAISQWNASNEFGKPIVTEVSAYMGFYDAEEYHQDFYRRNPTQGYVVAWTIPKVKKLEKLYPDWYVAVSVGE